MKPRQDELYIACAAIKSRDGEKVYSLDKPARHHHIIKYAVEQGEPTPVIGEQGFLTNSGKFVRRKRAKMIARRAGQLLDRASDSSLLFSEDVW